MSSSRRTRPSASKLACAAPERSTLKYSSRSRAGDAFAIRPRCSAIASRTSRSRSKPSRAPSTAARNMRTGSSTKRTRGSPIDRISLPLEIGEAADVVDDRVRGDVVEEPVDREVAAERVLFGRAERVVVVRRGGRSGAAGSADGRRGGRDDDRIVLGWRIGRRLRDVLAERRDLDRLLAELDVRQAEAAPDDPAVPEQPLDLGRVRARADVEVLGPPAEDQVADAAADQVRRVIVLVQAVEHAQRVGVDVPARNGVIRARDDDRIGHADDYRVSGRFSRLTTRLGRWHRRRRGRKGRTMWLCSTRSARPGVVAGLP